MLWGRKTGFRKVRDQIGVEVRRWVDGEVSAVGDGHNINVLWNVCET